MEFKGGSVIITGASGGVGSETACLFAREGANITVNYFSSSDEASYITGETIHVDDSSQLFW